MEKSIHLRKVYELFSKYEKDCIGILSLFKGLRTEKDEISYLKVKSKFDEMTFSRDQNKKDLLNSIDELCKQTQSKSNSKIFPNPIKHNIVSEKVIAYCAKWGVMVNVIHNDNFVALSYDDDFICNPLTNISGIYLNDTKVYTICISEDVSKKERKNSIDSLIIHELVHILMKVNPSLINEFVSPFTAMCVLILLNNDIQHGFIENIDNDSYKEIYNNYVFKCRKTIGDRNFNSFREYLNSFNETLIKNGLIDENLKETFDSSKVNPELHWINKAGILF